MKYLTIFVSLYEAVDRMAYSYISVLDFLGKRFVFGMQEPYWDYMYDLWAPRNPQVYLATLSPRTVQVNISAPLAGGLFVSN